MAAARAMLDDIHEDLPRHTNDPNTYTLGGIQGHNIVIACLPIGQYGTNNAASVLTHLIRTFPSIRLGLMVGIGGGVPSKADMRLGDIVVGTRVMQYDLGKIVGDGQLQRTAIPRFPHQSLLTLVTTLRSEHELGTSRVASILREKLEGHSEYGRPSSPDRLFHVTYHHESPKASCDGCDHSKLALRSTRMSDDPKIHYGAIASGNQVMKDGMTRDLVAQELDIICFEMEAAGLMDVLPCLPIRGICDYSDSHKSKEWQRYAAATAAAYARELLEGLPVAGAPQVAESQYVPSPTLQNVPHDRRQQLLDSLRFEQIDSRKTTIKAAHTKTCHWFLQHPDYQAWLDPQKLAYHHGFLWIRGKPGAGKSTIMKFIYLKTKRGHHRQPGIIASFFFNARGQYLEKSVSGMYRSLLWQLLDGFPDIQQVFDDPDLVPRSQSDCPSLNVLKDLFHSAISNLGQRSFTCFLDALDECDELQVRDMVQYFEELAEHCTDIGVRLQICFSSRHYPYINIQRGIRLTLEDQRGHAEDLDNYIQSRLRINDTALFEELRPQVLEKAAGVFLWVVLVVDILNKENQQGRLALRKRLKEIPSGLSELFKDILSRDSKNMDDLLLCILWILYAERPLRPEEYYHAFWSGKRLKDQADPEIPAATASDSSECVNGCVISSSKGLAEITKVKQPTVQFIHESVRDFLVKDRGLYELWPDLGFGWEGRSHERLKKCCDLYMSHHSVRVSLSTVLHEAQSSHQTNLSTQYPFLEYASQNVLYHANAAADTIPQDEFLSRFPVPDWINTNNFFEKFKVRQYSPDASLLYLLADKGFSALIRTRLKEDSHIHVFGERYEYPLFAALANGNKDAVAALLGSPSSTCDGVDITEGLNSRKDLKEYKNRTPLSWAAQDGRTGIVKLLLNDKGVDVNARDKEGWTPLLRASEKGHEAVGRLLIDKRADVNARDKEGWTPLLLASLNGHEAVARLLIDKGADVDASGEEGWTPLLRASEKGHEAMARLFIDKGADVNGSNKYGWTPLLRASEKGHEAVVRLLIDKGADVDASDKEGWTPLLRASEKGHEVVARLLVAKGAPRSPWTRAARLQG
ncbi:hypothetical protein NW754_007759 [Fusarium falciforme]|nr:hypothetical protein NW754_007759 [Fusarium falciforme]